MITGQPAIFIYLANLYPEANLAQAIDGPLSNPYLRWLVFHGSCFEPAGAGQVDAARASCVGDVSHGDYDTMLKALTDHLEQGPHLPGETFGAVDVPWEGAERNHRVQAYARVGGDPYVYRSGAGTSGDVAGDGDGRRFGRCAGGLMS